jgi:hypothetical protein
MVTTLKKSLKLDKLNYYIKHISLINIIFIQEEGRLSPMEIKVLASFIKNSEGMEKAEVFATLVRNRVMKELSISHGGLSNHLRTLKEKGVIVKDTYIAPALIPKSLNQEYLIKLEYGVEE